MSRLWPRIPAQVIGHTLPRRFRSWPVRFADPDRLLVDFVAWLEVEHSRRGDTALLREQASQGLKPATNGTERDRELLVEESIALYERIPNVALSARLLEALERVGVTPFEADGARFDPQCHCAVDRRWTADPALHNHVASTDRQGWVDRGRICSRPEVVVYRTDAPRGA